MFFIGGVGGRVKPVGEANCTCPACKWQVSLFHTKKYQVVSLFFIPVIPFGITYFATCPNCASVMLLDKNKGKTLERDLHTIVSPEDLQLVQNNSGPECRLCSAKITPGQNFCPNCGERLYSERA